MSQPPYTRRMVKNLKVPFQVYARSHRDEWYVVSGNRNRPFGKPIVITEIRNVDQYTVEGTCADGRPVIFGGPSGKHWIIEDPEVEGPEFESTNEVRERPNTQGDKHYMNNLDPEYKVLHTKLRSVTRSITMANERMVNLGLEIERTKEHIDHLIEIQKDVRQKLSDQKGNQA